MKILSKRNYKQLKQKADTLDFIIWDALNVSGENIKLSLENSQLKREILYLKRQQAKARL